MWGSRKPYPNSHLKPNPNTKKTNKQVTDFFFVAFALVFFGTRLVVFPFHVFLKNSVRCLCLIQYMHI